MKGGNLLTISALAALSTLGLGRAFGGLEAGNAIETVPLAALAAAPADSRERHHGWWRGRGGGGHGRMCGEGRETRIEDLIALAEDFLEVTPAQAEAWGKLSGALRDASAALRQGCHELDPAGGPKPLGEQLAWAEAMMAAGLGAVQRIRPAFEEFYAVLSDRQRAALDDLAAKRRHH